MSHHGAWLRAELEADGVPTAEAQERVDSVMRGDIPGLMGDATAAMASFVRKLSRSPSTMSGDDVQSLRSAGLSEREIYDVTAIAGLFGFLNRLALGLGVPLERNWQELAHARVAATRHRKE